MNVEETCDHYGSQVAVRFLEGENETCAWCGGEADRGVLKSERHSLFLCEDCGKVLKILMRDSDE